VTTLPSTSRLAGTGFVDTVLLVAPRNQNKNMRDSEIEQRILLEISGTGRDAREICVLSSNGIVTLHGTVRTRQSKAAIQRAAGRVETVVAVINQLKVAPVAIKASRTTSRR